MDHTAALAAFDPALLVTAAVIMLLGGFVKGAIGFALPMITISGLGSFLSAQETVAILILPTFLSNLWQTLAEGRLAARETLAQFWKLNLLILLLIGLTAQLVPGIPSQTLFVCLGLVVATAAGLQLAGWRPRAPEGAGARGWLEVATGITAGILGGLTGVWGPPILFYLIALDTPKTAQVRAQGVSFLVGSTVLVVAHLKSGILDGVTLPVSALMCVPVMAGMWLGRRMQARIDQALFRRLTLIALCVAGLNLLRRGLF